MLYIVLNQISRDFGALAPIFSSLISIFRTGSQRDLMDHPFNIELVYAF
jgi:hypothetical protein